MRGKLDLRDLGEFGEDGVGQVSADRFKLCHVLLAEERLDETTVFAVSRRVEPIGNRGMFLSIRSWQVALRSESSGTDFGLSALSFATSKGVS